MKQATKVILRPYFVELAMAFAAGYVVGRYLNVDTPTVAELENILKDVPDETKVEVVEASRKPMIQYNNGVVSVNLKKGRRIFR